MVLPRLDQHAKQKDFWTHAAVFTSKDQNLNKAHVQYLEARLVQQARDAKGTSALPRPLVRGDEFRVNIVS